MLVILHFARASARCARFTKPGSFVPALAFLALFACKNDHDLHVQREPPEVAITAPADGSLLVQDQGVLDITGTVSDLPDAADTLAIQWSFGDAPIGNLPADHDGNVATSQDLMAIEPGTWPITLAATDSEGNTTEAHVSVEIVAPSAPPVVEITAPDDGSTFEAGEAITFTGSATDPNDAADDLVFSWTSTVDGAIPDATSGGGLSFVTTSTLTEGVHTIVLAATDLDGETGTASIVVTVGDEPDPPTDDPEPGEMIFSELMINPDGVADEIGEWVELYNTGERWLDIGGYSFHDDDTDQYTLQGTIRVPPLGYVVLCANLDPQINGGVHCDGWFNRQVSGGLALANVPDEVVLTRPDGVDIDELRYADAWVASGASIALDPGKMTAADNDDFANWCFQTSALPDGDMGTPQAENDPCE
jgi:hypothetical protein